MENLDQRPKIQRTAELQKIIQMCHTMINEENTEHQGGNEVENLVTQLTQSETKLSIQSNKCEELENQKNILMDLMRIPEENRNFLELRNSIEKLQSDYIEEKERADNLAAHYPLDVTNEDSQDKATLENIINNPGLLHLAENIFLNLGPEDLDKCQINKSSNQILDNPMFWLKKFGQGSLSKKNREDWIKAIQSNNNSDMEKKIISYLKWSLKTNGLIDLPLYTNPDVQNAFREKIWEAVKNKDIETVKILAPLTDNPNAPDRNGTTPIHWAASNGHTEIVKILAPLADNPNAPNKFWGKTPIYWAACNGHTEIVKILAPLTDNPNAPDKNGDTPIHVAAIAAEFRSIQYIEIVKILAPLTDNPNAPNKYGYTPSSRAKNAEIRRFLE